MELFPGGNRSICYHVCCCKNWTKGRWAMEEQCQIIPLINYQETAPRWVWCRQCGEQFQAVLPRHMRLDHVMCRGCEMEGFLVGQVRQAENISQ